MKKTAGLIPCLLASMAGFAQNRFPKPDFESGYQYPQYVYDVPSEMLWTTVDIFALAVLMGVVAWASLRRRTRLPITIVSIISIAYFGFFRKGCICSIGSVQNVAVALTDSSYAISIPILIFFVLPLVFALLFGRVFCAGVCPFGALQELVNVRNFRIPTALSKVLGMLPWIYLVLALLFAITHSAFIICRFDPFVGIFRLGGTVSMIVFGAILLILAIFTGRPFCRFLCPYGAILSLFSRVAVWNVKIVKKQCINCDLCRHACYVDAIRPPYNNKVKESRSAGVRRILLYLILLPLIMTIAALTLRTGSDLLAGVHKRVQLHEKYHLEGEQAIEVETFIGQGGKIEELTAETAEIQRQFKQYSTVAGALIGLVIGITLINLSLKRSRKNYEIDDANCVSCGRCFAYCPQNNKSSENTQSTK
ncbi:MAG: 4Fe-4S binding protein [Prevotellaceae bacterium]|nr:4Fe-4S binding protein [Prevotellaceae bacterium]